MSKILLVGLLLSAASPGAAATTTISGQVVVDGEPLPGANVVLAGTPFHAITDTAGTFRFAGMAAGLYRIYVSHVGYASSDQVIETGPDGAQDLLFSLAPSPGRLDPVVVTASRAPATLLRSPVTAHVLDAGSGSSGAQTASDLLRALPGIDLSGGGAPGLVAGLSLRGAAPGQTLVLRFHGADAPANRHARGPAGLMSSAASASKRLKFSANMPASLPAWAS